MYTFVSVIIFPNHSTGFFHINFASESNFCFSVLDSEILKIYSLLNHLHCIVNVDVRATNVYR